MGARRGGLGLLALVGLCLAVAPVGSSAQSPAPPPLRISIDSIEQYPHSQPDQLLVSMVFDALYRWDDHYAPQPNLVTEACAPDAAGTTLTCHLVDATFHDGAPLTADDVVYTYEISSASCPSWMNFCLAHGRISSVEALDDRTVAFHLPAPDATFVTEALPFIRIMRRADIEASYARFAAAAGTIPLANVQEARTALDGVLSSDARACTTALDAPEALLRRAGALVYDRSEFRDPVSAAFDACAFAQHLSERLADLEAWHGTTGIDAIATAYLLLDIGRKPNGTGPFRVTAITAGTGISLAAFDGYHFGRPAVDRVEAVVMPDPAEVVASLTSDGLDVAASLPIDLYDSVRDDPDLRFAKHPDTTYIYMGYNVREGQVFADVRLRQAIRVCIDKARIVESATADTGVPIESDILPVSWAYQPSLHAPTRDVAGGRALIESAGWTAGADGVYARDGQRLHAEILVRADTPDRVRFAELVALQVADCGIELVPRKLDFDTELAPMLDTYPHIAPGTGKPYDLVMGGFLISEDPDGSDLWHSRSITSAEDSKGFNRSGFADVRVDTLLDEALATYDLRERARAYREIQDILADQQPALFGWSPLNIDVLSSRLDTTDGALDLERPNWWWKLEDLVLRDPS